MAKKKLTYPPFRFKGLTLGVLRQAARYVDLHGSFQLYIKDKLRNTYNYKLTFMLKDPEIVDFMHRHFGGYRNVSHLDRATFFWLNLQQRRAIKVAEMVLPHLQEKKVVCERFIAFKELLKRNARRRLTDQVRDERAEALREFQEERKAAYKKVKEIRFKKAV